MYLKNNPVSYQNNNSRGFISWKQSFAILVRSESLSHVWLFATLWTVAYQAPPSMGFSRHCNITKPIFHCIINLKEKPCIVLIKPKKSVWFPRCVSGKKLSCQCRQLKRHWFSLSVGKIPWSRKWQPTHVFLPGKFHGQRAWWATVHGAEKSQTWLSTHTHLKFKRKNHS